MKYKKFKIIVLFLIVVLVLSGCAASKYSGVIISKSTRLEPSITYLLTDGTAVMETKYFVKVKINSEIKEVQVFNKNQYKNLIIGNVYEWTE